MSNYMFNDINKVKKVLFVSSGNSRFGISSLVKNQGKELIEAGLDINYFVVNGKGFGGYLKSIPRLKSWIKENDYDLIHAHYGVSGIIALLSFTDIVKIISLMGDDVLGSKLKNGKISFFGSLITKIVRTSLKYFDVIIVKSDEMAKKIPSYHPVIIPNGVSFEKFYPMDKHVARKKLNIDLNEIIILFPADKKRVEKNYPLLDQAVQQLKIDNLKIIWFDNVPHDETIYYYNAADIVVLTSMHEGSPNAIKEAMACNIPIVATDVGDIRAVIGNTAGCYLTTFDFMDIASKIELAILFGNRTNGRDQIIHLRSDLIAEKLVEVYTKVLNKECAG